MQRIDCHGTAREMGRQYGEAARDGIRRNLEVWLPRAGLDPASEFVAASRAVLTARAPEVLDELDGIAAGAGVSAAAVLCMNHVNSVTGLRPSPGCTSMAVAAGADGPVLGKNNDGDNDDLVFVTRQSRPDTGLPMVQVTYAGWLSGLDAMNAAGLVNGHNSVGSVFERSGARLEIRLWVYRLLRQCRTTAAFIAGLADVPLTGKGFNIVVADSAGDVAVLEAAVPLVACRDRGRPFVFATNHYVSDALKNADRRQPRAKVISTYRLGYLDWLDQTARPAGAADVRRVLASHEPWAPCRHGGPHQSQTLWSMIGLPGAARLLVAPGAPCQAAYETVEVG